MTQTLIGQRLKILIAALELDVRGFSQRMNVAETTTRNYLNRGTKPGTDYLEKLSNSFSEANLHWLLTGLGTPLLSQAGEPLVNYQKNTSGIAQAGSHRTATQHNYTLNDCEKERDQYKAERDQARAENTLLRQQLDMAQGLIAAKDETLTLLRASRNKSN